MIKAPSVLAILLLTMTGPALQATASDDGEGAQSSGVIGAVWPMEGEETPAIQDSMPFQADPEHVRQAVEWMHANLQPDQIAAIAAHLDIVLGRAPPLPLCDPFVLESLVDCILETMCGIARGACLTVGVCLGFRATAPIQVSPTFRYGAVGTPFSIKIRTGPPIFNAGINPAFGEYFAGVSGVTSC